MNNPFRSFTSKIEDDGFITHQSILRSLGTEFWSRTENLNLLTPQSLLSLSHKAVKINLKKHYLLGMPSNLTAYGDS
jgi:hypothetical protein